jgi:AcrR family transcriptional regulator
VTAHSVPPAPSDKSDHRTGPRRRGDALYQAIFAATLAELAEVGYPKLAMERVAARARTSKASLYKRWPNRAELVLAALRHQRGEPEPPPDTGNLRDDVLILLRRGATRLNGVMGEVVRGLMAETLADSTPIAQVRTTMFDARNAQLHEVFTRAADRGDIATDAIRPDLVALAPALVDHHFLFHGAPIPDEVLTGIVDGILLPLLVRTSPTDQAACRIPTDR